MINGLTAEGCLGSSEGSVGRGAWLMAAACGGQRAWSCLALTERIG